MTRYRATWEMENATFCCGAKEVGSLGVDEIKATYKNWDRQVHKNPYYDQASDSKDDVWAKDLLKMRGASGSRPIMFNIVVDDENTKELRTLLNAQEDCYHIHTWKNPGTGRKLEMYVLTNGSSETNSEYEDNCDDDY